jgi:hypothetical protein
MSDPLVFGCRVNASGASGVGVRCNGNASLLFSDVDGVTSDLRVETGAILSVYANQYETTAGAGTVQALRGDRSAWDVTNYPAFHAKDIEDSNPVYHNPAGAATGQAPVWNGSEWIPTDITTQAELDAVKDESFVVMAATADLANERVLTAGANITITDGGAGGAVTIAAEGGGGGHVHGLTRWEGAAAQTNFELPDVAEYVDWVADNGLMFDPGEDYSLDADGDTIILTSGLAEAAVITAGYVIAQI